jgi:hypothetical protein
MKVYKTIIDAMVTIHPSRERYIFANSKEDAKIQAEEDFMRFLEQQFGWIDYDEVNVSTTFLYDFNKEDIYSGN